MQIIKQKIQKTGKDSNLIIPINAINNQLGYQQEIDSRTQIQSQNAINGITDYESRKFGLNYLSGGYFFSFQFESESNYYTFYTYAGFTSTEVTQHAKSFDNSFFILDFYDTYDPKIQQKLFTTYITKLEGASIFIVDNDVSKQLYYCYVPNWFIEKQTSNEVDVYFKLFFYNAKSGNVKIFYSYDNVSLTTPEKYYVKAKLDLSNKSWQPYNQVVIFREDKINTEYRQRVKDTVDQLTQYEQDYPEGDFSYANGKYM